jgi:glucokinase
VRDGQLFIGDNSIAGEAHLLRNLLTPGINAEEGASIRAVRRVYAEVAGIDMADAPDPAEIFAIGTGCAEGHGLAAREAFRRLGLVAGDVLAQALALVDGLAVVGGGISGAHPLFLPAMLESMNGHFDGGLHRIYARAYNLEDAAERDAFLRGEVREIAVPYSSRKVVYDPLARTAVGISRLGTSKAVAIGACAFALARLG